MHQHPVHAGPRTAQEIGRQEGAPQVDVGQALPRVADAPVDLDGGLAHVASRSGAVGLGHRGRGQRVVGREGIDGPGRMQGDAAGPLHQHEGIGQQVLDGLERTDGRPELLAEGGVARSPVARRRA